MDILVYGAGVLGSLYAARLQEAGHAVALLARGPRRADLQAHGIVLDDAQTGRRTTTYVRVVDALARTAAVPTPALERLTRYLDPATPPLPEGSAHLPLRWRGVWWIGLGGSAALVACWRLSAVRSRA